MADLTAIVIAQNEEKNIGYCLCSVCSWVKAVFVVDGGSKDSTRGLAQGLGAQVFGHPFVDFADQRNWALANLPVTTEWVLFLDADEQVLAELRREIEIAVQRNLPLVDAYSIQQAFVFLGKHLTHAHGGPHLVRLVRRTRVRWVCEGPREYCLVQGQTKQLHAQIWHEDQRGIRCWTEKHTRYASSEVKLLLADDQSKPEIMASRDRRIRTWIRTRLLPAVPYQVRPLVSFFYRYIVQRGILDGYPGFVFCIMHALWYPLLIDSMVYEGRSRSTRT